MLISQQDFLKILTEPQDIILGNRSIEHFIEFLLKEYRNLEHICFRTQFELVFMEDELSFSSYLKIDINESSNQFQFLFENEEYESIAHAPEDFQKNIAYIALDTIKIVSKWQDHILQEELKKKIFKIDETENIHKALASHFKIKNKYKNLIFEISYSGEEIEQTTLSDEDNSDFDWI